MKNQERKINPPVFKHIYRYFVCYSRKWKVILTYEDWGYYLGGIHPHDMSYLKIEQLEDWAAQRVLKVVEDLQSNKEKNEKN